MFFYVKSIASLNKFTKTYKACKLTPIVVYLLIQCDEDQLYKKC